MAAAADRWDVADGTQIRVTPREASLTRLGAVDVQCLGCPASVASSYVLIMGFAPPPLPVSPPPSPPPPTPQVSAIADFEDFT